MTGAQIDIKIQGIPCIAEVTHYTPADPGCITAAPENCWPPEPAEIEYEILDRKGYKAAWLERKATQQDHDEIYETILKELENE